VESSTGVITVYI